ncbi:hypothetical protein PM082_012361 [Marasmius tenuissimus]|nr:hypothetical protein PM082_012361 [Marasmius tenuissimus]
MAAEGFLDSRRLLSQRDHLRCVVVGCLAIVFWDIVIHLRVDLRLIRRTGIHLPQIAYILLRIAILAFLLTDIMLLASRVSSHCSALNVVLASLESLHYTLVGLLRLLRVRAMYRNRLWAGRLFVLLWIASSGMSIWLSSFRIDQTAIVENICMHTKLNVTLQRVSSANRTFQGACIIAAVSMSFALSSTDLQPAQRIGLVERFKTSVIAKDVPTFSKSLLRRSQWDFLLLFSINLLIAVGIGIDRIPIAYRVGILRIAPTFMNCGVCSAFRNIARSKEKTEVMVDDLLPISFNRNPNTSSSEIGLSDEISGTQGDGPTGQRVAS